MDYICWTRQGILDMVEVDFMDLMENEVCKKFITEFERVYEEAENGILH